jgi:hypothetical protein
VTSSDGFTFLGDALRYEDDTWRFLWQVGLESNGTRQLRAEARDNDGNRTLSDSAPFPVAIARSQRRLVLGESVLRADRLQTNGSIVRAWSNWNRRPTASRSTPPAARSPATAASRWKASVRSENRPGLNLPSRLDLVLSALTNRLPGSSLGLLADPKWKGTASDLGLAFPDGSAEPPSSKPAARCRSPDPPPACAPSANN